MTELTIFTRKTISMEDDLNGRQPQLKTNSMEDDLNGRRPQPKGKNISMEEYLDVSRAQLKPYRNKMTSACLANQFILSLAQFSPSLFSIILKIIIMSQLI